MSICTSRKAQLQARLVKKQAQLDAANDAYDALIANNVEDYKFDSNEGSQRAKRRRLEELTKLISTLESEIEALQNRLCGIGVITMNVRRKRLGCY
jgi:hypothetical protein